MQWRRLVAPLMPSCPSRLALSIACQGAPCAPPSQPQLTQTVCAAFLRRQQALQASGPAVVEQSPLLASHGPLRPLSRCICTDRECQRKTVRSRGRASAQRQRVAKPYPHWEGERPTGQFGSSRRLTRTP